MRNRVLLFASLFSLCAASSGAVPSTERLVAATTAGYPYYNTVNPDTYLLTQQGGFEGWFYSPFEVSDMASRGHELLAANNDSGTIARLNLDGGLVGLINTPANGIGGIAVGTNGDLFVSEDSSNQILRLNSTGNFLDMVFVPQPVGAMGVDSQDRLVYSVAHDPNSYNSLRDIVFFDFDLGQVVNTVNTQYRSILGLDFSDTNEILVVGSTEQYSSTAKISRLSLSGQSLGDILGPSNVRAITLVSSPEPSTALLVGLGLALLGRRKRPGAAR
jgi:hypothetical protein